MADGIFIPLGAPAVRAILDGAKTQVRWTVLWRVAGFGGGRVEPSDHPGAPTYEYRSGLTVCHRHPDGSFCGMPVRRVPALVGGLLRVVEPWAAVPRLAGCERVRSGEHDEDGVRFRATWDKAHASGWRTPLSMPREVCRLGLRVTSLRVERVQAITDADAVAEGVRAISRDDVPRPPASSPRDDFRLILQRTRGHAAWCSNPWVWVIGFAPEVMG